MAGSLGIFSEEQILAGLKDGTFRSTDLAWAEGMSEWQPIGCLPPFRVAPPLQVGRADYVDPQIQVMAGMSKDSSGLATASLVCGILSLFSICCCLGWPLTLAAVICGHLALSEIQGNPYMASSRSIAIAGLAMGYFAIALGALGLMFGIVSSSLPK